MMKRKIIFVLIALIALLVALSANEVPIAAQSGGGYDLTWNTIDGGGGTSAGGGYSFSGTIGQSDAGTMSGGSYTLNGGFWVDFLGIKIMLPLIMR